MNYRTIVINLDRREDRYQEFLERFGKRGVEATRFSAIDGEKKINEPLTEFESKLFNLNDFRRNKEAEFGCWLSHVSIWKDLAESTDDMRLIFEDDAHPVEDFEEKLKIILDNINPEKMSIIFLGGKFNPSFTSPFLREDWNKRGIFYFFNNKRKPIKRTTERTTHCYILTKMGAKLLMNEIENHMNEGKKFQAIDDWLTNLRVTHKFLDFFPHITYSPINYKSDIQK
jgi:GR25 family glycosyltransferase involved in LPS biosynthesis